MFRSCIGRACGGPSPPKRKSPPQKTLQTASKRELEILLGLPNVSIYKKRIIRRELRGRNQNKNNYGYEMAKMFGTTPPPSNKWLVEHANVKGRIAQEAGMAKSIRKFIHPEQQKHFIPKPSTPKSTNPQTRLYRITRKVKRTGLEHTLLPIISNRNPKIYKNSGWKYKAVAGGVTILYNNRNSVPFIINKKTGKRKPVPENINVSRLHLHPRNMKVETWNAYTKRVNQLSKKFKSLQKANNYATGRTTNKPANSTMRFYFNTHPRARVSGYNNPRNIQREIKNSIQSNLFENMPVPNRANLREKWQMLTNTNHVKNLNNLVNKMANYYRAYRESNEKKWNRHAEETFAQLYERAVKRNKYLYYYS